MPPEFTTTLPLSENREPKYFRENLMEQSMPRALPPGPPPRPPQRMNDARHDDPSSSKTLLPSEIPSSGRNYQTIHDPQLGRNKEMLRRFETHPRRSTTDPRMLSHHTKPPKSSRLKPRKHLERLHYKVRVHPLLTTRI